MSSRIDGRNYRRGGASPINGPRGFPGETGWPAFENSWGNTGGGRAPASFAVVDDVLVIQGSVTGGVSGTVVFTLPVGYRPDASYTEPGALTIDDELASVTVDTDGTVTIATLTTGVFFLVQAPTASAPTYAVGGMYYDTTLNKLRVGGAAGWETVTSA